MASAKGVQKKGAGQSVNAIAPPSWESPYSEILRSEIDVAIA